MREVLQKAEDTCEILGTTLALRGGAGLVAMAASIGTLALIQRHDRMALLLVQYPFANTCLPSAGHH